MRMRSHVSTLATYAVLAIAFAAGGLVGCTCRVHGDRLETRTVEVEFGLRDWPMATRACESRYFPHHGRGGFGGCDTPHEPEYVTLTICPKCVETREEFLSLWRKGRYKFADLQNEGMGMGKEMGYLREESCESCK